MKKLLSVLLMVCLCFGMAAGCGAQRESEKESVSGDFDEATNVTVQIKGLQFEVPKKWEESAIAKNESKENVKCFKSEDIYLKVIYGSNAIEKLDDESYKAYLSGLGTRFGSFEIGTISDENYNGMTAKKSDVSFTVDTEKYNGDVFTFEVAEFIFGVKQGCEKDYASDIQKVLASIKTVEYQEVTKDLSYIFLQEDMRWNMARAEVEDIEKREIDTLDSVENGNMSYLAYEPDRSTDEYSNSATLVYCFEDDYLKAYWCSYDVGYISDYKELYDKIKDTISEKYGECESEDVKWTDETYQNEDAKWNDAFRYGYVTVKTIWHTEDTAIVITWDYNSSLTVAMSETDFENRL